jgi:hypothetical protein
MPSSGRIRNPARLPQLAAIAASPPRAVDGPGLRQRRADVANRPAGPDVGAKGETIVAERFLCVGENGEDALGAGHGFSCLPPVRQSFMQSLGIRPKQRAGPVEGSASGRIVLLCGPHPVLVPHLLRAFRSRAAGSSGKPLLASVRSAKSRHGKSRVCARTRRHEARRRAPFLRSRFACRFFCPDSNGSRVARRLLWSHAVAASFWVLGFGATVTRHGEASRNHQIIEVNASGNGSCHGLARSFRAAGRLASKAPEAASLSARCQTPSVSCIVRRGPCRAEMGSHASCS